MINFQNPLVEIEETIVPETYRHREYIWRVPILEPFRVVTNRQDAYTDAIIGSTLFDCGPRIKEQLRYKIRSRYTKEIVPLTGYEHEILRFQVWLLPNEYTMAQLPKKVAYKEIIVTPGFSAFSIFNEVVSSTVRQCLF